MWFVDDAVMAVDSQRYSFPPGGCWPGRASLHLSYPSSTLQMYLPQALLLQPPASFPFHSFPEHGRQAAFLPERFTGK